MIQHSLVIDDFLHYPEITRDLFKELPMMDYLASDNVTYPGIVETPDSVNQEIKFKLSKYFNLEVIYSFGRYSFEDMDPPNWAHSDREMAEYLALLYLGPPNGTEFCGTLLVRHRRLGFDTHPINELELSALQEDSNNRDKWEVTYNFPSRYNRMVILNANYIHAAAGSYGTNHDNGRLVLSTFFRLKSS